MVRCIDLCKRVGRTVALLVIVTVLSMAAAPFVGFGTAEASTFVNSAYNNTTSGNGNNPTLTVNFGTTATRGNLLVLVCSVGGSINGFNTPSGYSVAAPFVAGAISQAVFYKEAGNNESSASCGVTGRARNMSFVAQIYEYSGVEANALDVYGTALGTGTSVSSGGATPSTARSLIFATITSLSGSAYSSPTAGFTKRTDVSAGMHISQADILSSTSVAQHTFTATNNASSAWRGQIGRAHV